jgi:hypothetical protein
MLLSYDTYQKFMITLYRTIAFSALALVLLGIFSYITLVLFYFFSNSWAAPLQLSPSQERVLAFQPQIANLEALLLKQRVELTTAEMKTIAEEEQLVQLYSLEEKIRVARRSETRELRTTTSAINSVIDQKRSNILETQKLILQTQKMLQQVQEELDAKLITSDQAAQRQIALQTAINSATDAKTQLLQLDTQSQQLKSVLNTFTGGSASLAGLQPAQQLQQLSAMISQLDIEIATAKLTVTALKTTVSDGERVLAVAKSSPYYAALRSPISVLFVPYDNINNILAGQLVYDCYLQIILCHKVGTISAVYDAEEYARHPLFKTDLKGKFVGVLFEDIKAVQSQVVFINRKPLFL